MIIEGTVLLLVCPVCGAHHPHFRYSGDTDMATDGLSCAGDRAGSRLSLFRIPQGALEHAGPGGDLRSARLARVIERGPSAAGLDFATFRKRYRPPELKFHCPWCDAAEMAVSREMKPAEFVDAGGRIDCIGAIELREGQTFL
ncbi:hypothetical protein U4960_00490 [Altererythrobacter sp. H2]|uniref:hypothetical protein n=1 Tax=Altererythrobacter sp. H2 TaxID=3108391 RepID=UPI002B4BAF34|nr:hypothetical protein [Altererythrobacter sp. H2]WRK95845.1 hypothetical protein U4960_00490 [Altererythrobacter sp. H2]